MAENILTKECNKQSLSIDHKGNMFSNHKNFSLKLAQKFQNSFQGKQQIFLNYLFSLSLFSINSSRFLAVSLFGSISINFRK